MFFLPLIHTPTDTKSKINYKHQKSTTKLTTRTKPFDRWSVIVDRGLERRFGSVLMEIGFNGDRCWWRSVMGWRRSVLMEIGFNGDRCWWSAWDGLTEIGVDGVLVMVLLGWQRLVDWRGVVVLVMVVVLMESLLWCLWVLIVRERRRKKLKKRKRKRQR